MSCQIATLSKPFLAFFTLVRPRSCMTAEVVFQIPTLFEDELAAGNATLEELVHPLICLVDQMNCPVPIWWDSFESFRLLLHNEVVVSARCQLLTNFFVKVLWEIYVVALLILRRFKEWVLLRIRTKPIDIFSLVSPGLNLVYWRFWNPVD